MSIIVVNVEIDDPLTPSYDPRKVEKAVFGTITPTLVLGGLKEVTEGLQVLVDDGDDATADATELTQSFSAGGPDGWLTATFTEADTPFKYGLNRLTVDIPGLPSTLVLHMLSYTEDEDIVVRTLPTVEARDLTGIEFVDNEIVLAFTEEATDQQISSFLSREGLIPVDAIRPTFSVLARRDPPIPPDELPGYAEGLQDGILISAYPNLLGQPQAIATPNRLGSAFANLNLTTNTVEGVLPGGVPVRDLRKSKDHFAMESYVAHGLVDRVRKDRGTSPQARLMIVDGGFGRGEGQGAGLSSDIPQGRILECVNIADRSGVPKRGLQLSEIGERHWWKQTGNAYDLQTDEVIPNQLAGHGTPSAHSAAGGGDVILGTGRNARLVLAATSSPDVREARHILRTADVAYALAERINTDEDAGNDIDVMLCTPVDTVTPRPDEPEKLATYQAAKEARRRGIVPQLKRLADQGTIVVYPAGNNTHSMHRPDPKMEQMDGCFSTGWTSPLGNDDPLLVNVGQSRFLGRISQAPTDPDQRFYELVCHKSQEGNSICVVAPGGDSIYRDGYSRGMPDDAGNANVCDFGGTFMASSYVAGALAELVYLDRANSNRLSTQAGSKRGFAAAVIESLNAGAEAPSPYLHQTAAGNLPNKYYGYGRINLWRSALVVLNAGLPEANARFPHLPARADGETHYYGFRVFTSRRRATLWLVGNDGVPKPLRETDASGAPDGDKPDQVRADLGVIRTESKQAVRVPVGSTLAVNDTVATGERVFAASFTMKRDQMRDGADWKTLQIRTGTAADSTLVMEVELNPATMRGGVEDRDEGLAVGFDCFVFDVDERLFIVETSINIPTAPYQAQLHVSRSAIPNVTWSFASPPPQGIQLSAGGLLTAEEGFIYDAILAVRATDGSGRETVQEITFKAGTE